MYVSAYHLGVALKRTIVLRVALVVYAVIVAVACNHTSPTPAAPVVPSPLPMASNSAPVISASVSPGFGVEQLTTFTARIEVNDPDGDGVTLTGRYCGVVNESPIPLTAGVGTISSTPPAQSCGGFQLTATDTRGARTEQWVSFHAIGLSVPYDLFIGTPRPGEEVGNEAHFGGWLKQYGTVVTGVISEAAGSGVVDPETPGTIDATGRFKIRFTIGNTDDLEITGQLNGVTTGDTFRDLVIGGGTVTGPRFGGKAFQLRYHSPY